VNMAVFSRKSSTISNFCRYLRTGMIPVFLRPVPASERFCGCLRGSEDNLVKFILMLRGGGETRDFDKVSYRKFCKLDRSRYFLRQTLFLLRADPWGICLFGGIVTTIRVMAAGQV